MTYVQGFVIAVPTAQKDRFIEHATRADAAFIEQGATRVVECWQADVPKGQTTDFFGAVDCQDGEEVVFSWIEWPDKATHDRMAAKMDELIKTDDRFDPVKNPMPFDGKRMIYGDFEPIVERGRKVRGGYMQGFIVPAKADRREDYRKMADEVWDLFAEFGGRRVIEAWQDNVPRGQQTDFYRAVKAEPEEAVVFSFIEWDSKEACEAAHNKMMADERMKEPPKDMPFDGKRMVFGGFTPVVELGA
jgi:uncharacterized protein YbaA (DUF1428 family)